MTIQVKYFASLGERLKRDHDVLDPDGVTTVADVWARAGHGQAVSGHILAAVNLEHADWAHPVRDGDEVAFFPPVTGG